MNSSDPVPISEKRAQRRLLLAAASGAAVLGGALAWWKMPVSKPSGDVLEPVAGFWSMQWETPQGGTVSMQALQGRPLLVNFWATWCPPCVEELPLINDFYRQNKSNGWQVLGLAVDKTSAVQSFLAKMPLDFPVAMAGILGAELGRNLGNLSGGLPFSVALSANGGVVQRKLGRLSVDDLQRWADVK
jgi:thiol-disulfide isomerase/thioredoxin